jgi:hypothetical protein
MWYAQLVIYPMFAKVGPDEAREYHRFYARRIPLPVILPGFASFFTPIAVALYGPVLPAWQNVANMVGGMFSFVMTVAFLIPRHSWFERHGKNPQIVAELVRYNWVRTAAMTVQAGVTICMLAEIVPVR